MYRDRNNMNKLNFDLSLIFFFMYKDEKIW